MFRDNEWGCRPMAATYFRVCFRYPRLPLSDVSSEPKVLVMNIVG